MVILHMTCMEINGNKFIGRFLFLATLHEFPSMSTNFSESMNMMAVKRLMSENRICQVSAIRTIYFLN